LAENTQVTGEGTTYTGYVEGIREGIAYCQSVKGEKRGRVRRRIRGERPICEEAQASVHDDRLSGGAGRRVRRNVKHEISAAISKRQIGDLAAMSITKGEFVNVLLTCTPETMYAETPREWLTVRALTDVMCGSFTVQVGSKVGGRVA
jgi:hypothetical protein